MAAADNNCPGSHRHSLTGVDHLKEFDGTEDIWGIFALDSKFESLMGANTDEDSVKLSLQVIKTLILADHRIAPDLDPQPDDGVDLRVQDITRQSVRRDAVAEHTAGLGKGLEHGDRVAVPRQLEGATQAGRTCTDNSHFFVHNLFGELFMLQPVSDAVVTDKAFKGTDIHRTIILLTAVASGLAGMRTDAAADRRKGCGLARLVPGLFV